MKLLHVITTLSRGGAENHLVDLIKQQVNHGYKVSVAYLQREGYWRDTLEDLGVQVVDLGLPLRRYGDLRPIFRLRALIHSFQPNLVHAHLPPAELYTRLALLGISTKELPMVISKHNDTPFYKGVGSRYVGKWVANRADQIIAISEAVNRTMCGPSLGCSPQRVLTIPYGIDPVPFEGANSDLSQELRQNWNVSDEEFLIGTVARLHPQKALHILLAGFAQYLWNTKVPARLVVVGEGLLAAELRQQAAQLGIQEQIIWAGFRTDIPVVMNALDLFCLTSAWEGLGLVLLEAMAAAKPVVASNVSAIPEIVVDKVTGLLVPPLQPDTLAEAFRFFEDDTLRRQFGLAGRERVKSHFTLEHMTEQTLMVYQDCLKKASSNHSFEITQEQITTNAPHIPE